MRRRTPTRGWIAAAAAAIGALAAGLATAPALAVTNLYAPQDSGSSGDLLAQYAVAADGSLTELAPAALGFGAQDMAITPDGRYAYVTRSQGSDAGAIAQFARGAGGRMQPGAVLSTASDPQGILVDPQGARVYYALGVRGELESRPIESDGTLGAATTTDLGLSSPRFLAMTPSGTSLYVADAGVRAPPHLLQFDVDPATGDVTPKAATSVAWPTGTGATAPADVGRLTVSPDGRSLYATSATAGAGIARYAIDATGGLSDGSIEGSFGDAYATAVVAMSPSGGFLWAPTSGGSPGQIGQYAVVGTGATGLDALAAGPAPYVVDATTRDAVASPSGTTLYLGQDANVGEWTTAAPGTVTLRADHPSSASEPQSAGVVLAPSQAPVASFTASPQPSGQPTTFDASASSDPDGSIARYDWDFGDGTTLADGGPTPSHVYAAPGTPTVTLTVTDADGTSTAQLWTGSRMLRDGGPSARTSSTLAIAQGPGPAPTPEQGRSVTIRATSGTVRVKLPGSKVYVDVSTLREIPLGSRIDARFGHVLVTAEVDAARHVTQSSTFYAGIFVVTQTKGSKPILVATLAGGTFAGCAPKPASTRTVARGARFADRALLGVAATARRQRSKRKVRSLWGHGKGDFRTAGRRSSATVRGTWWLVEDRCDGTLTQVKQGFVDVRDTRRHRTIRLRAGKRSAYLAKAP